MKLNYLKKTGGFTLIEMMVVISIIAILSVASVNGYESYRRSTLVHFAADNLVSEFNELKSRTLYQDNNQAKFEELKGELSGEVGEKDAVEVENLCYGMQFKQDGEFYSVTAFSQKFDGKKVWDDSSGWVYRGCPKFDPKTAKILQFEMDPEVKVISVEGASGDFVVQFEPPKARLIVDADLDSVLVKLQYGQVVDESLQKIVKLDFKNALAQAL